MAESKRQKRIRERLEQIKQRASEENARQTSKANAVTMTDLAEEAAGLGLELLNEKEG
jgi:hypothetical protein